MSTTTTTTNKLWNGSGDVARGLPRPKRWKVALIGTSLLQADPDRDDLSNIYM